MWISVLTNDKIKGDLLKTLPQKLIVWTWFDALTHSLEYEISDLFDIKAIELIFEYLPRAVNKAK